MEKRNSPRIDVDLPLLIYLSSGDRVKAHIINLSERGLAIRYPVAAERGTELDVQFSVYVRRQNYSIRTRVRVMHNILRKNHYAIGLEMLDLNDEQRNQIRAYIAAMQSLRSR